jgi:uncharacterized protein (DUF2461 family)
MTKATSKEAYFSPELFKFLEDLRDHNNRGWFEANKERFLTFVRDPLLRFITDFGPHLKRIDPNFVADPSPVGGSLFQPKRCQALSEVIDWPSLGRRKTADIESH